MNTVSYSTQKIPNQERRTCMIRAHSQEKQRVQPLMSPMAGWNTIMSDPQLTPA
jgi:hypothetical protein